MGVLSAIRRERETLSGLLSVLGRIKDVKPDAELTIADKIDQWAEKNPNKEAIVFEDQTISYGELSDKATQIANWALNAGVKRGDTIALVMENKPEYIMTWYAAAKAGFSVALINTNLQGLGLAHTLNISNAGHIVLDSNLADNYASCVDHLDRPMTVWAQGGAIQGAHSWDDAVAAEAGKPLPGGLRDGLLAKERFVYIYTSGTTGLPKAANISHQRFVGMGGAFAGATKSTEDDRVYVCLPLYHATGGVGGVSIALTAGGTLILRRKFSASAFFNDCIKYRATIFVYIGELCRYLLNAPENPNEQKHKLRIAMGNGLRPEVWEPFQKRFAIPRIVEFYGSTEGNVALFNVNNKVGSIGRIPSYLSGMMQTKIVKFDVENEEVVRGPDGHCIECAFDEVGEAIGKIDPDKPGANFEGYNNKEATEKKILRDVFEPGDKWFRTGDLLKKDKQGYFYFIDRIGDTFRWKGENVATSEVAEVMSQIPQIKEANVYGVQVPGADGRAGMASIVVEGDLDFAKLEAILDRDLAAYAQPMFLRLQPEMEVTGTFKHRKVELVKEGFNPAEINEPLYFRNPQTGHFEELTGDVYTAICEGGIRL